MFYHYVNIFEIARSLCESVERYFVKKKIKSSANKLFRDITGVIVMELENVSKL